MRSSRRSASIRFRGGLHERRLDGAHQGAEAPAWPAPGAGMSMRFEDPAAEFIPAVERVFGAAPRILDGSRAVLVGEVKLQLEAGERELWLIETHGVLEHRLGMVEVELDIEAALLEAKAKLDELN